MRDDLPSGLALGLVRATLLVGGMLGAALLVSACGGSTPAGIASLGTATTTSNVPTGGSGGPPSAAETRALLKYSQCVQSHGVPSFPDPQAAGGWPDSARRFEGTPEYLRAARACRAEAVASGVIHTPAEIAAHVKQLNAEDVCIQKHGFPDMPGPTVAGAQSLPANVLPTDPRFEAANKACGYLNP